jgi:hypothetical protein
VGVLGQGMHLWHYSGSLWILKLHICTIIQIYYINICIFLQNNHDFVCEIHIYYTAIKLVERKCYFASDTFPGLFLGMGHGPLTPLDFNCPSQQILHGSMTHWIFWLRNNICHKYKFNAYQYSNLMSHSDLVLHL